MATLVPAWGGHTQGHASLVISAIPFTLFGKRRSACRHGAQLEDALLTADLVAKTDQAPLFSGNFRFLYQAKEGVCEGVTAKQMRSAAPHTLAGLAGLTVVWGSQAMRLSWWSAAGYNTGIVSTSIP